MGNSKSKPEFDRPWRDNTLGEGKKDALIKGIKNLEPCTKDLKCLRILVAGPCGQGKSSFINSVNNAFKGRITSCAQTDRIGGVSFTNQYQQFKIDCGNSSLPVIFNDIMGLETGSVKGCPVEDIIKAVHGHVRPGHLCVLAANRIQFADDSILHKMRDIRMQVRPLELPQVIVLSYVDEACPLVKSDLQKIYVSKKIKEKMQWCSDNLGIAMSHIFPVKNYHEEIESSVEMDVLILQALSQIIHLANDNLKGRSSEHFQN